jgi:hypothetical protein
VDWLGVHATAAPWASRNRETDHKKDRECRENEETGEIVVGFKELKHGKPPRRAT